MTAISIGPGATDRSSSGSAGTTMVSKTNPANDNGNIDTVEIFVNSAITSLVVATFYVVSGNSLSTRASVNLGNAAAGKQTFTGLTLPVQAGDFIGAYFATGAIDAGAPSGSGRWYKAGNYIPCTNTAFTSSGSSDYSIGASGKTPGGLPLWRIGTGIGVGIKS